MGKGLITDKSPHGGCGKEITLPDKSVTVAFILSVNVTGKLILVLNPEGVMLICASPTEADSQINALFIFWLPK
ncbi:MAG TPA: hypothetical protein PKN14_10090 [Bacteroidia bacterium]|nr:hypothetical protein [Bacteroidia bacterium]HNR49583.1 hypothetical protein [Bacteroidia bacterium]HNT83028.1 hypothetical protein [Bacteroidia bacterium]